MKSTDPQAKLLKHTRCSRCGLQSGSVGFPECYVNGEQVSVAHDMVVPISAAAEIVEELKDALDSMVGQFAYEGNGKRGRAMIHTGGLSALERAFYILGYDDPHYTPDAECNVKKCYRHATCGTPESLVSGDQNSPYRRVCGDHWGEMHKGTKLQFKSKKP